MTEPQEQHDPAPGHDDLRPEGQDDHGSLTVEDDPAGTQDPADLAGTANSDDDQVGPSDHQ